MVGFFAFRPVPFGLGGYGELRSVPLRSGVVSRLRHVNSS